MPVRGNDEDMHGIVKESNESGGIITFRRTNVTRGRNSRIHCGNEEIYGYKKRDARVVDLDRSA